MKKRIFLSIASLLCIIAGYAGNIIADDITMKPDETQALNVSLSNSVSDKYGIQFELTLPKGFSLVRGNNGQIYELSANQASDLTCSDLDLGNGTYRFVIYSSSLQKLNGGSLMSINLKADGNQTLGNYTVSIDNVALTDYEGNLTNENGISVGIKVTDFFTLLYKVDGEEYKSLEIEYGESITPEAAPTKEGYTFSGWSWIPSKMPAEDVTVTGTFAINKYKVTYIVDGAEYKSYDVEFGAAITQEAAPTKEGYTFSGWSEIPATMPAKDITVTGSFTINKYKLTYMVDGAEYKSSEIEFGAKITPEAEPTKEGYTFSGWSSIPETMPAKDITVTGSFTINKYKLTYMVDGAEYKSSEIEYGAKITPETEPTKEGYTFSGWSSIPETMPAKDVTVTGTFTKGAYKLTYMLDGAVYKTVTYDFGAAITPEAAPTKEGYTFSGWSEIPSTMPAKDITVMGLFTINKYKLTYMVDGTEYKSSEIEYGAKITPEIEPTKEGYTFSGWSTIPETMPSEDVVITGTFEQITETVGNVTYQINGDEVSVVNTGEVNGTLQIEATVTINGNTYNVTAIAEGAFQGCTGITSLELPASIVTIASNAFDGCTGLRQIKLGKGLKEIASKAFANIFKKKARTRSDADEEGLHIYCEAETVPVAALDAFDGSDISEVTLHVADNLVDSYKSTAPWSGFGKIIGFEESTGINTTTIGFGDALIFDMQGNRLDNVRKGVNIIRAKDGKSKKVVVK
jgi:uncharacterized repeat protein (TIGR02543 family)